MSRPPNKVDVTSSGQVFMAYRSPYRDGIKNSVERTRGLSSARTQRSQVACRFKLFKTGLSCTTRRPQDPRTPELGARGPGPELARPAPARRARSRRRAKMNCAWCLPLAARYRFSLHGWQS
ncbi:hypothetical protein RRG08_051882 [Elysia crispata]|uniref:Uncharacterized protein n=1 Tax=Elysia crispata TaxID=231223 RepID=A0AAE0Z9L9_9GAST|nr:hypothetical protein RRG08_051882 [Elysia crispata]